MVIVVEGEVAEAAALEAVIQGAESRKRGPKRRISWIFPSTWTKPSASNLVVVVKVRSCPKLKETSDNQTVTGTLKGYDQLMNLVLDDVQELLRGMQRALRFSCLG